MDERAAFQRLTAAVAAAGVTLEDQPLELRAIIDRELIIPGLQRLRSAFSVDIRSEIIGGVRVDVITPADGVSPRNSHRVLINLHGGGMAVGGRYGGQSESAPIAALGRFKVISIDYRMAPELARLAKPNV